MSTITKAVLSKTARPLMYAGIGALALLLIQQHLKEKKTQRNLLS